MGTEQQKRPARQDPEREAFLEAIRDPNIQRHLLELKLDMSDEIPLCTERVTTSTSKSSNAVPTHCFWSEQAGQSDCVDKRPRAKLEHIGDPFGQVKPGQSAANFLQSPEDYLQDMLTEADKDYTHTCDKPEKCDNAAAYRHARGCQEIDQLLQAVTGLVEN